MKILQLVFIAIILLSSIVTIIFNMQTINNLKIIQRNLIGTNN